ncbi:MAG TPA: NAD(P)-binding domain-containing protein [Solirubrobacteraceae bacterium]|jgi:hypothetical protein
MTPVSTAMSAGDEQWRIGSAAADTPAEAAGVERVGIVGAGKLGTALARAALAAGYDVAVASSGPADRIALSLDVLAPGAVASTVEEVVEFADVIVLAVPAHRFRQLPSELFDGKILVDAMNYWPDTDGEDPELARETAARASSCKPTSPPPGSSRASISSATTSSMSTHAIRARPIGSRSPRSATTGLPCGQ